MIFSNAVANLFNSLRVVIYKLLLDFEDSRGNSNLLLSGIICRSLIERISVYFYYQQLLKRFPIPTDLNDRKKITDIELELVPLLNRGLNQSPNDIKHIFSIDIRTDKMKPFRLKKSEEVYKPLNVMTTIDKLDKKIKGTKNAYELLSNFVHPNFFGNHSAVYQDLVLVKNEFGDSFLERKISAKKPYLPSRELSAVMEKANSVFYEILLFYFSSIEDLQIYQEKAKQFCRRRVQRDINDRGKKIGLRKGSKCPCLSGKRVKDCCGKGLVMG